MPQFLNPLTFGSSVTLTSPSSSNSTNTGTITWPSQSQNFVWAAPSGSAGVPTFRALAFADLPISVGRIDLFIYSQCGGL